MHFKDIKEYVLEEKFKILYIDKKVDLVNYLKVEHFDSNKISVLYKDGIVDVLGERLVITRMIRDELVIDGIIKKIELR